MVPTHPAYCYFNSSKRNQVIMIDTKFRALGDIDRIWVYGNLFKNECCTRIISNTTIIQDDDKISGEITLVDPKTVGQLTGLKDKNGTEIYNGDIIQIKHPFKSREFTGEVVWMNYKYGCKDFLFTHFDDPSEIFSEGTEHIEVIGNIHIELLES